MGLDSQPIADGTYFLVEEGRPARRLWRLESLGRPCMAATTARRCVTRKLLDPAQDAARIRAMYTDPDFTRRGVGRLVLRLCETAARKAGFTRAEMMATLAGEPLYPRRAAMSPIERVTKVSGRRGRRFRGVRMGKPLV